MIEVQAWELILLGTAFLAAGWSVGFSQARHWKQRYDTVRWQYDAYREQMRLWRIGQED
jgi:predicted nicotinamide N-methyase